MKEEIFKTKEDILKVISKVLIEDFECDPDKVTPEAELFTDLDLDSIDAVDLVVKLQKITGKRVNPEAFRQVRKLGDVVDVIYSIFLEKGDS